MKRAICFLVSFAVLSLGCFTKLIDPVVAPVMRVFESDQARIERVATEVEDLCPTTWVPLLTRRIPEIRADGNNMPDILYYSLAIPGSAAVAALGVAMYPLAFTGSKTLGMAYPWIDHRAYWYYAVTSWVHGIRTGEGHMHCVDGVNVDYEAICIANDYDC